MPNEESRETPQGQGEVPGSHLPGPGGRGPEEPPESPYILIDAWMEAARSDERIRYANAACLATVDAGGRPDARIVLLKEMGAEGWVFYTNLRSPKAQALREHPEGALTVFWEPLGRQVRVRGPVEPVSPEEADAYFASRPRGSQVGAWASEQSEPVPDRATLERRLEEVEAQYRDAEVPRPPHWSGFRLHGREVELWIERKFRLHDRFLYRKQSDGGWRVERLYP